MKTVKYIMVNIGVYLLLFLVLFILLFIYSFIYSQKDPSVNTDWVFGIIMTVAAGLVWGLPMLLIVSLPIFSLCKRLNVVKNPSLQGLTIYAFTGGIISYLFAQLLSLFVHFNHRTVENIFFIMIFFIAMCTPYLKLIFNKMLKGNLDKTT